MPKAARFLSSTFAVTTLRAEALTDPLAIAHPHPRLSWTLESDERAQRQTAYEIIAASRPDRLDPNAADLWRTGKILSSQTLDVEYQGTPLAAGNRCWWKVRVWDKEDQVSAWSSTAVFGAALSSTDWTSEWIGFDRTREIELPPAPFEGASWIWLGLGCEASRVGVFVGTLNLPDSPVIDSEVAISVAGRGRFWFAFEQFWLSDDEPEPWRRPHVRHMTERLRPGPNHFIIRAERIGDEPPGVAVKVTARTADGHVFTLVSGPSWRATDAFGDAWYDITSLDTWPSCAVVAAYGEAPWGTLRGTQNILPPPAYLRRTFHVDRPVVQATAFATALGAFDLHVNGARVNDSYFDPGWTDYRKRLYYRAYDVTSSLRQGENVAAAVLADGWYCGHIGWLHQRDLYGKRPRLRAQLHIRYADGTTEIVGTDDRWRASLGPITEADMLMGEVHDARDERPGWDAPGFDAPDWMPVSIGADLSPALEPHPGPPVVALEDETFAPKTITEPAPGTYIFDLGQNFAGIARLRLLRPIAGQRIRLRFGERLNADGTLYTINLRTARATDTYICRGDDEEVWSPRFTFHGFQYVEVTGLTRPPEADTITGVPLSSDTPRVGWFECSDALANRLATNVYWSQRSNFIDIITDCPQRDERLGWCDGTWTFARAAALRTDVQAFYRKWMVDLDDAQRPDGLFPWLAPLVVAIEDVSGPFWHDSSPAWQDAGIICPWMMYDLYGDRRQLADHYPAMVRQIEWYVRTSQPDLLPAPGHRCLGDWLNYDAEMPADAFRTAFFAYSADLVARAASVLGHEADARRFGQLRHDVRAAFRRAFVDADGRVAGDTQSSYAFALTFDLLDEDQAPKAAAHLVDRIRERGWRISTGLEGTLPLMVALSKAGRSDVAYRLLHQDAYPSWNFSTLNGATTIWERWNSWTPEDGFGDAMMNSFNHFSLGAVYQWMVETIGGIQVAGPACRDIVIAPVPGGRLTSARASYMSPRGRIDTDWRLYGDAMTLQVRVPANSSATIRLPAVAPEDVTESGRAIGGHTDLILCGITPQGVDVRVDAGTYSFLIQRPRLAVRQA